jgi:hypothetical protein
LACSSFKVHTFSTSAAASGQHERRFHVPSVQRKPDLNLDALLLNVAIVANAQVQQNTRAPARVAAPVSIDHAPTKTKLNKDEWKAKQ